MVWTGVPPILIVYCDILRRSFISHHFTQPKHTLQILQFWTRVWWNQAHPLGSTTDFQPKGTCYVTAVYEIGSKNCKFERPGMHWVCIGYALGILFHHLSIFYWQTARQVQNIDANHCKSKGLSHPWGLAFRTPWHAFIYLCKAFVLDRFNWVWNYVLLCRLLLAGCFFSGFCLPYCIACWVYLHSLQVMFLFLFCSFCSAMLPSLWALLAQSPVEHQSHACHVMRRTCCGSACHEKQRLSLSCGANTT